MSATGGARKKFICEDCGAPCYFTGNQFDIPLCSACLRARRREAVTMPGASLPHPTKSHVRQSDKAAQTYYAALQSLAQSNVKPLAFPVDSGDSTIVCILSDWHIGKESESYNKDIATDRVCQLTKRTIDLATNYSGVTFDEVVFLIDGDICDGEGIYEHQAHQSDLPAFEQLQFATSLIWEHVSTVAASLPTVKSVRLECVPGNHGTIKVRGSAPINNWDNIVYYSLSLMAGKSDLISVGYSVNGYRNVKIKGHTYHLRHVGPKGASTAAQQNKNLARRYANDADALIFAHFHHLAFDDFFGPVFWNGCLCGPDELSEEIGVSAEPAQWIFGVTDSRVKTFQYGIDLL